MFEGLFGLARSYVAIGTEVPLVCLVSSFRAAVLVGGIRASAPSNARFGPPFGETL